VLFVPVDGALHGVPLLVAVGVEGGRATVAAQALCEIGNDPLTHKGRVDHAAVTVPAAVLPGRALRRRETAMLICKVYAVAEHLTRTGTLDR
jgi:hypothetical protein